MATCGRPWALALGQTAFTAVFATAVFVALLGIPGSGPSLTRGPYLQLLTSDGVTVVWHTDDPAACGLEIRPIGGTPTQVEGDYGTSCAVPVTNLVPGMAYIYKPLADGAAVGPESLFRTDDPALPFNFLVLGDSGSGLSKQMAVRDAMLATPADFILHTGDMIYDEGEAQDFDPKFFEPYAELIRRLVLWPCLGNHDVATADGAPWREAFFTPANNLAGTEDYYSFDFGNAHIVVLDSTEDTAPGSPQHTFLDLDLEAATDATWKFVAFHHSIYSSRRAQPELKANLTPLFDQHGVDVVFMGHAHSYERTRPLRGDQIVTPEQGTVYVTTGGGGESVGPVGSSTFTAYAESSFHFTRVVVGGEWLLAQMVREDGAVRDQFVLEKGASPPPAACGDDVVNRPEEACDGLDHPACPAGCRPDCTCVPRCGDGTVNQPTEQCDLADDAACSGLCLSSCRCGTADQVIELLPVADTYIAAGDEATWDHGVATALEVDDRPGRLAYLKFDLGLIADRIGTATLVLRATGTSPDGGTVYPVGDSSWLEGDRTGAQEDSASGPGLKWVDVDTNGNGEIDEADTSPYAPMRTLWTGTLGIVEAEEPRRVDVTAAVQHGPDLYSFVIKNDSSNRLSYASREAADEAAHPVLRLELAVEATCNTDADCEDAFACTIDACVNGVCSNTVEHGACDDGQFCNGDEWCDPTLGCQPGAPQCDDAVDCTVDLCEESTRSCRHVLDDERCADGNACNGAETCDGAAGCQPGPPADGAPCDDANPCTLKDTCLGGVCVGTSVCGNDVIDAECGETCDGASLGGCAAGCVPPGEPGACTCVAAAFCGDGAANQPSEQCDGEDGGVCPGACLPDCHCAVEAVVEADAAVDERSPNTNFGADPELWVDARAAKQTFLRIRVGGIGGRAVEQALLRMHAAKASSAGSDSGGRVHRITNCAWDEAAITWDTRPSIDGERLGEAGAVQPGDVVAFDVTAALTADGVYCLALDSGSSDGVIYDSKETPSGGAEVVITLRAPCRSDSDCENGDPCAAASCDGGSGNCTTMPAPDGTACTDGICCAGLCTAVACAADADCGDGNTCTADRCDAPASCSAACANTWPACGAADGCCPPGCDGATDSDCPSIVCGNGLCEGAGGEDCFSCPADCRCQGRGCKAACCGDGTCDGGENTSNCPTDCG